MITNIMRTAVTSLRRDRGALALSFVLPVVFFTIFAVIFGGRRDTTPTISLLLVDEDHSAVSERLVQGMQAETSLRVAVRPAARKGVQQPLYTRGSAEAAVRAGDAPIALIIPAGFGQSPLSFAGNGTTTAIEMLKDPSDMVAPQVVSGLLQKVAMTSMPDLMAEQGVKAMDTYAGGLTPEQRQRMQTAVDYLRHEQQASAQPGAKPAASSGLSSGLIKVNAKDVVGENKNNPMVSFYAAAIGVMFLLFTASGSAGVLLEEAESGTLDRVLSTRVNMTTLMAGKVCYNTTLAFVQLVVMFVWAWLVFKLDFTSHLPGFVVMGVTTSFAVASFGMLLASACKTRAQLGALSTLVILIMSSIGGSMFPRFLMPAAMQKAGLLTINAWAIDGFTKVFWRDEPISHLWPQVTVLVGCGIVLFLIARRVARRWEFA
ncbi:MAG: ABC transporter permease [Terriglobales bacterium]